MLLLEVNYQLRQYSRSIESVAVSCEVCACNRSMPENLVFVGNQDKCDTSADYTDLSSVSKSVESQSELVSSYQSRKPDSGNAGNQCGVFNYKSDSSGNQCDNFNLKSDNSGNQFWKFNHESHNTGNQSRNSKEECDFSGTSSVRSFISKVTECQNCGKTEEKLNVKERYVPLSNLMSRKIKNVLQQDQLRSVDFFVSKVLTF